MTQLQANPAVQVRVPSDPNSIPAHVTAPAEAVERFMDRALEEFGLPANLLDASKYALLGGGKRLRPLLVIHAGAALGAPLEPMLPTAAAVEMIHAFSLVHDDLPALDNDELRRGQPTLHKKHGEAMAILAGDGLMSTAFQVLTDKHDPALAGLLCRELALGTTRMICGQVLDTLGGFGPEVPSDQRVALIHRDKTGALIRASCRMGVIAALGRAGRRDDKAVASITTYGESIGLMFQIVDDLLDVEQSAEHTGKKTGKDIEAGKLTYPGVFGVSKCRQEVERLRGLAHASVDAFGPAADALRIVCDYLAVRTR